MQALLEQCTVSLRLNLVSCQPVFQAHQLKQAVIDVMCVIVIFLSLFLSIVMLWISHTYLDMHIGGDHP